jgi:branched-chain amino acid transport system ATP-binding protein
MQAEQGNMADRNAVQGDIVLELKDVATCYGKIQALQGISFTVRQGQIVTLLGANGAGKSTTLRTISGLNQASAGRITFMGEDITARPPHDIVEMGLIHVPEGRRIFKGMTIQENLELGSFTLKDDQERKKRMTRVFEIFPILHERRSRDSALLSGGEQQMLAMGRALMTRPKLLLLDEPSMGLAPFLVKEIMRIIVRLNKEGVTILLVEQNARVALQLASHGYVLETGTIVIRGDAETLRRDESIVKAYLGE